jgi:hypothetical protein
VPDGYGASSSTSTSSSDSSLKLAQELAPIIAPFVTEEDARTTASVLRAKIKNYEQMKKKLPFLAWWYDNEIRKMKAELKAVKEQAREERESAQATRTWRNIGYAAALVGIVAGLSFVAFTTAATVRLARGG